jgi:hypothetical protein
MSALTLSGIIFVLTLGGIFLGTLLRRTLPEHHLNEHARDVTRSELIEALRREGCTSLSRVRFAVLETDGTITVGLRCN